jgi:hypothetical protein
VTERTDPSAAEPPPATRPVPADPALDAIQPHPGREVPWPPRPDQRGLAAPYPPGGSDPDPDAGLREERYYLRLLIAMVLLIVVGGFVIGIIGFVLGFTGSAG